MVSGASVRLAIIGPSILSHHSISPTWVHEELSSSFYALNSNFCSHLLYILDNNHFLSQWKILNTARNRSIHSSLYIPVYPKQICQDPTSRAHCFVRWVGWEMNLAPISARGLFISDSPEKPFAIISGPECHPAVPACHPAIPAHHPAHPLIINFFFKKYPSQSCSFYPFHLRTYAFELYYCTVNKFYSKLTKIK